VRQEVVLQGQQERKVYKEIRALLAQKARVAKLALPVIQVRPSKGLQGQLAHREFKEILAPLVPLV
jgi:hypothetical protein